jgi:hypothetical protein
VVSDLRVTKYAVLVPTTHDDQGRPYCVCGCGEVMIEESPGRWICEDRRALRDFLAARVGGLTA